MEEHDKPGEELGEEKSAPKKRAERGIADEIKNTDKWLRGLYMVLFLIIVGILKMILGAVILFQFVLVLLTSRKNANLIPFSKGLAAYLKEIYLYLTYCTDKKPYPFAKWPTE